MKKRLGLVFILAFIVGLVILIFSDRIEFERNEATENYDKALYKAMQKDIAEYIANADGNVVYDENAPSGDDQLTQYAAEYIESMKDIFDKKKHLLEDEDDVDVTIDLKMFKQGDEYHFGDLFWNISNEQVVDGVEYSLLEDPDRTQGSDGYSYYVSEGKYVLYRQTATATFWFYDDQLKSVRLEFIPGEKKKKIQAFFDRTVKTLIDIYGQESVKSESDTTDHVSYQWIAEETMLQVELIDLQVIISVGVREVQ